MWCKTTEKQNSSFLLKQVKQHTCRETKIVLKFFRKDSDFFEMTILLSNVFRLHTSTVRFHFSFYSFYLVRSMRIKLSVFFNSTAFQWTKKNINNDKNLKWRFGLLLQDDWSYVETNAAMPFVTKSKSSQVVFRNWQINITIIVHNKQKHNLLLLVTFGKSVFKIVSPTKFGSNRYYLPFPVPWNIAITMN